MTSSVMSNIYSCLNHLKNEIVNEEKFHFQTILDYCAQEKFENNTVNQLKGGKNRIYDFQNNKDEKANLA